MGDRFQIAPAYLRRAFFVSAALVFSAAAMAGPGPTSEPPTLAQVGKPNATESARILEQFRRSGWHGYIEFDLHALPKRGEELVFHGRLWGGQSDQGAVTRIEVVDGEGKIHRLLLQNGSHASVWRLGNGKPSLVDSGALLEPLIHGVEINAFDLQMPFLYWPDAQVESVERVRGRPAYLFAFHPPAAFAARIRGLTSVRAYFDAQFNAPLQIETLDGQRLLKTMSLVDLKKVGEQTIPRSFDIRNEKTRDKTRFEVTAVALNVEFPPAIFTPESFGQELRPPAPDRVVRLGQ